MRVEISTKLERLGNYVTQLEELRSLSLGEFEDDPVKRAAMERFFQMAIESVIDICSMIISHEDLQKPEEYRGMILTLGNAGILEKEFAETFSQVAGFRNILVHQYAEVDMETMYQLLQGRLSDFDTFARQIASYLDTKS